jgi:hypothetical protein
MFRYHQGSGFLTAEANVQNIKWADPSLIETKPLAKFTLKKRAYHGGQAKCAFF